jgi:hypothetical protein
LSYKGKVLHKKIWYTRHPDSQHLNVSLLPGALPPSPWKGGMRSRRPIQCNRTGQVHVRRLCTLTCQLQFIGQRKRQHSPSMSPTTRGGIAAKQSRTRRCHHKKHPGLQPQWDPDTKTTTGRPSPDLKDDIFSLRPHMLYN